MKQLRKAFSLALAFTGGALATGCSEDVTIPADQDIMDKYTKAYIKELGLPDPNHDWSMATQAGLKIKSENSVQVKVFAELEGERYIFADLGWFQGESAVPVTIPKNVGKLIVEVNGMDYIVDANGTFDIDNPPAGSRSFTVGDENDSKQYGLTFSEDSSDKKVVSFTTDDNPWIADIINDPWGSDYLLKDSKGQPLFPGSRALFRAPVYTAGSDYRIGDMDVAPLYIKDTDEGVVADENAPHHVIGVVPYSDHTQYANGSNVMLPYEDPSYGISCNGSKTSEPSTANGNTWSVTTYRINSREYKQESGISYWTRRNSDINHSNSNYGVSHSVQVFNQNYFSENYWNAQFLTDCDAYCSCLFYNVDVKLTDGTTRPATVYALYASPKGEAVVRAQKPDVYILEFYPENTQLRRVSARGGNLKYTWRIMAEDLGGTGDWDFNDVVFDYVDFLVNTNNALFTNGVCPWPISSKFPYRHEITITPRAAGGTLPIYIAWEGNTMEPFDYNTLSGKMTSDVDAMNIEQPVYEGVFVIGKEIHDWFGVSTSTMVNTYAGIALKAAESVTFVTRESTSAEYFEPNFFNFRIIRDDNNEIALDETTRAKFGWSKIMDKNEDGSKYLQIHLPKLGESYLAPQMMCVKTEIGWPTEQTKINLAYPSFADWNEDKSNWNTWYGSNTDTSLIINVADDPE